MVNLLNKENSNLEKLGNSFQIQTQGAFRRTKKPYHRKLAFETSNYRRQQGLYHIHYILHTYLVYIALET